MNVPNFLIIGAAKAATTSLSSLLDAHPEAGIVRGKEPHFFSYDQHYAFGWNNYLQLYAHHSHCKALGDASTSYSRIRYHPQVIPRIQRHMPEAKIIYMVRHPIERMESAYVEHLCSATSLAFPSLSQAVRQMPMILDSSRYWEVFDAYRKAFGEKNVKVVWFEEYIADTPGQYREVCRFLGIDETVNPDLPAQKQNSRDAAAERMAAAGRQGLKPDTSWEPELRQWVIGQLRDDNLRLLEHFGRKPDHWGGLYAGEHSD